GLCCLFLCKRGL
nr:immunoglobulin heavy chain junction region [Mus musculus]